MQLKQQRELTPVVFRGVKSVAKENRLADIKKKHQKKIPEQAHAHSDFNAFLNAGRWTHYIVVQGDSIKQQRNSVTESKETGKTNVPQ